jgi:hypothetical protein
MKHIFVSYWALTESMPFMGNQDVEWDIQGMDDIEFLEKSIKNYLNGMGIPVVSVTIINWKVF